jgi:hypothetical protein
MELRFISLLHIINRIVYIENTRLYTQPEERETQTGRDKRRVRITGRTIMREKTYMDIVTVGLGGTKWV